MTIIILILFVLGYAAIALEHPLRINKAATALLVGVLCWAVYAIYSSNPETVLGQLGHHLPATAGILFFLMGAMTVVELVDAHDGFELITERIQTMSGKALVWQVAFIAFFLSAILDNLTTAIIMVSLLKKLVANREQRWLLAGLVVIAANAGGAWSPIGDVTTTMLWIGGQVTAGPLVLNSFLPSLVCLLLPTFIIANRIKGPLQRPETTEQPLATTSRRHQRIVFCVGLGSLLFVPIFKTITHLPPWMGMLFGLGLMWVITEMLHSEKDEEEKGLLSVNHALRKIDTPSILFFLGILLSIGALEATGMLTGAAGWLANTVGNMEAITIGTGLLSAVVDNVPLVAAAQGMYGLNQYPTNHVFWSFLAYCAGTGGSCLIIGSAAGIAAMGQDKIDFLWYAKKIGWLALLGYLAGAGVFLLQHFLLHG